MALDNKYQNKEWNFEDYLDLAIRRRWLVIICFVIVFGATVYYSLTRPPQYASSITFSIDMQTEQAGIGSRSAMPYYYYRMGMGKNLEYYTALLYSAPFRDKVIQEALTDSALLANGGMSIEEISTIIAGGLTLNKEEMSNLMYMSARAGDPVVAYRIAYIAGNAFKDRARDIEQEQSKNVVDYVESQVAEAERKLESAERELQEFKGRTGFILNENNDGIIQQLSEIENRITETQTQRQLAEYNINTFNARIKQMQRDDSSSLFDNESAEIVQLRKRLDDLQKQKLRLQENSGSSASISKLNDSINNAKEDLRKSVLETHSQHADNVLNSSENQYDVLREQKITSELNLYTLQNEEKYYLKLAENFRKQHPNILEHAIEYSKLRRAKTVAMELYSYLVRQGEEANIRAQTGTGGVLVVSPPALPKKPIPNKAARNILIGFALGWGLGFGLALVIDYFDRTLHTPEDVERYLDIAVVGSIPNIDSHRLKENRRSMQSEHGEVADSGFPTNGNIQHASRLIPQMNSKSPLVEAYRNLRTDLQFINVDEPITQLVITSSMPGEGKSLTTANLAISYAELGKQVLIVDCDMRKPMQHKIFSVDKSPGLSDCLVHNDWEEVVTQFIKPTVVNGLHILSAGTNPPNPAEMLASHKMDQLIKKMNNSYDMVIYDSPPVMAVSDPKILAPKVKNTLLVVRASAASIHAVRDAIDRISKVGGNVLGTILNGIGKTKGYGYYYKYSYYYNYSYYYDERGNKKKKHEKTSKRHKEPTSA